MMKTINPKLLPFLYQEELYRLSDQEVPKEVVEPVQTETPEAEDGKTESPKDEFDILVVMDNPQTHLDLLEKILQAVSLSVNDVRLIGATEEKDPYQYKKAILFTGKDWNTLPWHDYQIRSAEELDYLSAHSLDVISDDVNLKKKLWAELKKLFSDRL